MMYQLKIGISVQLGWQKCNKIQKKNMATILVRHFQMHSLKKNFAQHSFKYSWQALTWPNDVAMYDTMYINVICSQCF